MTVLITVTDDVPADCGAEAARLTPLQTVRAKVDWPLVAGDSEDGMRPEVVACLSRALAACGKVAFHCDQVLDGAEITIPIASRLITDRLLDLAGLGGKTVSVAIASDPIVIAALFTYGGWSYAAQSALVFDPDVDPMPIFNALRQGSNWRGRMLPKGVRLLFGPGHDGDFAVVAAVEQSWLERFKTALCWN